MGRAWTNADEERLHHVGGAAEPDQPEPVEPDALLLRDVVAGCIVHIVAVLLYRLRLAAPTARTLSQEIKAATAARTFWEWLGEPMLDVPECVDDTAATDC